MSQAPWMIRWQRLRASVVRLEAALLITAVVLVIGTIAQTVRVASRTSLRSDLNYRGAIDELEGTLQGLGPDSIARVVSSRIARSTHDSVSIDTISVVADTSTEPALAAGGFLRDQISRYNDAAFRLAFRDTDRLEQPADPDNLLRVIRTERGALRLSDQANATGLIVRSPTAEQEWRAVRTADAANIVALVGQSGSISMLPNSSASRASVNGRTCEVMAEMNRGALYCGTTTAMSVGRFWDLAVYRTPADDALRLETYRGSTLWLEGRSTTARGVRVKSGAVGELRATGPFLLSGIASGYLAEEQWVNGQRRLVEQPAGTIGFFSRAGRSARWPSTGAPLTLSLDAALSADIEQAAGSFFVEHDRLLDIMSVVVVDVASGKVRAIAEPSRTSTTEPLVAFEPRLVGSVVKPIIAAAVLARNPSLSNLEIEYGGSVVTAVDGVPLSSPFRNDANGCGERINFAAFLRCSSNRYAAELVVRSLRSNGYTPSRDGASIPRVVLEGSDLADGLALGFDVDAYAGRTPGRTVPFWDVNGSTDLGIVTAVSDASLLPYESRPWLLGNGGNSTPVDWIARYAFGGWENRWTLLGVAQSYARIATDREVSLSFLEAGGPKAALVMGDSVADAMRVVRRALSEVGERGTATPLNARLREALGQDVQVFAKTGTLNEDSPDDIAIKALALAVGDADSLEAGARLRCGLAVVVYFDFNREEIRRRGAASLPGVHVEFATQHLPRVLARHWRRMAGCVRGGVDISSARKR